jgi:hypothetical protein
VLNEQLVDLDSHQRLLVRVSPMEMVAVAVTTPATARMEHQIPVAVVEVLDPTVPHFQAVLEQLV